jgi:hypothetical protein
MDALMWVLGATVLIITGIIVSVEGWTSAPSGVKIAFIVGILSVILGSVIYSQEPKVTEISSITDLLPINGVYPIKVSEPVKLIKIEHTTLIPSIKTRTEYKIQVLPKGDK